MTPAGTSEPRSSADPHLTDVLLAVCESSPVRRHLHDEQGVPADRVRARHDPTAWLVELRSSFSSRSEVTPINVSFAYSRPDARDMQGGSRPMYRDDIFYGAGASRLSSQMSTRIATAPPTTDPILDAGDTDEVTRSEAGRGSVCSPGRCRLCPHAVTSTLTALLHHSILTNSVFLVFATTQVLVMVGYFTPFLFSQGEDPVMDTRSSPVPCGREPHFHPRWPWPASARQTRLSRLACLLRWRTGSCPRLGWPTQWEERSRAQRVKCPAFPRLCCRACR